MKSPGPRLLADNPPDDVLGPLYVLLGWLAWIAAAACIAGLLMSLGRMAMAHQRGEPPPVTQFIYTLAAAVLLGSAAAIASKLGQG